MTSHGDGRRMSVAEAIERRARMIRVHGSLDRACYRGKEVARGLGQQARGTGIDDGVRDWNSWFCHVCDEGNEAEQPDDVGLLDGVPVAMCPRCRAARREQPGTLEVQTLEDLASDFMEAVERLIGGSP